MTLPNERYQAIQNTRKFLRSLLDPKQTPKVPRWIRREAYYCLKHYPGDCDWMRAEKSFKEVFDLGGKHGKSKKAVAD